MFNQSPFTGPGAGSLTSHTIEILLMLLVAFILGVILARLLAAKSRERIDELESAVSGISAQNLDLSSKLSKAHGENETLRRRLAGAETEATKLRSLAGDLEFRLGGLGPKTVAPPAAVASISAPLQMPNTTLDQIRTTKSDSTDA
jgi:outer membrane murein-binding lipoprotein Lpp